LEAGFRLLEYQKPYDLAIAIPKHGSGGAEDRSKELQILGLAQK
jgi:hypothetical protein